MRHRFGLLLALGLGLGAGIPLLMGGPEVVRLLMRVPPEIPTLLTGMIFLGWNLNAGRVRLLTGGTHVHLGQAKALAILVATEFAICITPAGSGGPLAYSWLLSRHGLRHSRGMALYAADQFVDMLFFLCALCIVLLRWLLVAHDWYLGWQLGSMMILLIGTMSSLWLLVEHCHPLCRTTGELLRGLGISAPWRRRLARAAVEFQRSLRLVKGYSPARLSAIFLLCSAHWLLRYSVLYIAVKAVGGDISWSYAFVVQMLSLTVGQATLLPGGSGGAEASSGLLLTPEMEPTTAAAAILLWRFATFYWYLIAGAPVFAALVGRPVWRLAAK